MNALQTYLSAALEKLSEDPKGSKKPYLGDAAMVAGGLGSAKLGSPLLRGKKVFWHGTAKENRPSIKAQGIRTMGEMGSKGSSVTSGILENATNDIGKDVLEKSKNMAFVTKSKTQAQMYNIQSEVYKKLVQKYGAVDGAKRYKEWHQLVSAKPQRYLPQALWEHKINPLRSPMKLEIPFHELSKLKPNPEIANVEYLAKNPGLNKIFDPMFDFNIKAMKSSLKGSPGMVGGIDPKYVVGGKGYKYWDLAGMRKSPLRTAGGAAAVVGGLGLSSYAIHRAISRFRNRQKQQV